MVVFNANFSVVFESKDEDALEERSSGGPVMLGIGALISINMGCDAGTFVIDEPGGIIATDWADDVGYMPVLTVDQGSTVAGAWGCDMRVFGKPMSFEDSSQSIFATLDSMESFVWLPSLSSPDVSMVDKEG